MEARIAAPDATRIVGPGALGQRSQHRPEIDRTAERQRALERIRTSTTTSLTRCEDAATRERAPPSARADFE